MEPNQLRIGLKLFSKNRPYWMCGNLLRGCSMTFSWSTVVTSWHRRKLRA